MNINAATFNVASQTPSLSSMGVAPPAQAGRILKAANTTLSVEVALRHTCGCRFLGSALSLLRSALGGCGEQALPVGHSIATSIYA